VQIQFGRERCEQPAVSLPYAVRARLTLLKELLESPVVRVSHCLLPRKGSASTLDWWLAPVPVPCQADRRHLLIYQKV
jgi:hypothetical protein